MVSRNDDAIPDTLPPAANTETECPPVEVIVKRDIAVECEQAVEKDVTRAGEFILSFYQWLEGKDDDKE